MSNNLCVEVLRNSNDGNDLAPKHLFLVQLVVNGDANEDGLKELEKVCHQLKSGEYSEWYFDIWGLTLDATGYVYWFSETVEHYSFLDGNYSEAARHAAIKLVAGIQKREQEVISKLHAEGLTLHSGWPTISAVLSKTVSPSHCLETADRLIVRLISHPDWSAHYDCLKA